MDRRNFLKLTGAAAATLPVMGMPSFGGINRKPLPSEQRNLSTPGYIHSKDCFNFIQDPDEFQKGDLWIDPKDHIIYVYTPCTGQALYSILKEEWRVNCYDFSDEDLIQYMFPLAAITPQMFETQGDWNIVGLQHLRSCGLHITKTGEMYAGVVALGQTLETTHTTVNDFRFPYPGDEIDEETRKEILSGDSKINHLHGSNISVSCNLDREEIYELGRKGPYAKYVKFPVEVECEIEIPKNPVSNAIDWQLEHCKDARWDIVGRALDIINKGAVKNARV